MNVLILLHSLVSSLIFSAALMNVYIYTVFSRSPSFHFTTERLDDENMLYCSGCKKHVQAMKTVTLWRIPKILVVHLKRFEYRGTFNRSKIEVLVDFPLDGLDLDSHAPQSSVAEDDFVDDRVPMMYDLFGVVNHYGRMGYGHYTAHARRWDETGTEQKWAEFDDEQCVVDRRTM